MKIAIINHFPFAFCCVLNTLKYTKLEQDWKMKSISLLLLQHCPMQMHNAVQGRFALEHLQFPRQDFIQLHQIRSSHALDASGSVIHRGDQNPSSCFPPQCCGSGSCCWETSAWDQTKPAWYTALFTCCNSESAVSGIFSICRFSCEKIILRALSSYPTWHVRE